jgi:hypothetical protein
VAIVSPQAIEEAIDSKREDVVFLHQVGVKNRTNALCMRILVSCKDGQIFYANYHLISPKAPAGFSAHDFKQIQ